MDPRLLELEYRIQHQHADGSWGELLEEAPRHDAAAHDPERRWPGRRFFRCSSCGQLVALSRGDEESPAPDAG